VSINNNWN